MKRFRYRRQHMPEQVPWVNWLGEKRTVLARKGEHLVLHWRPRLQASMSFVFEVSDEYTLDPVEEAQIIPWIRKIRVSHLDPLDVSRKRVLASSFHERSKIGEALTYRPEIGPGLHHFLFEVDGFRPRVQKIRLEPGVDRLVRLRISPTRPPDWILHRIWKHGR